MRKTEANPVGTDHRISGTDYYQISISVLMVILGTIILFRSLQDGINGMTLLVGGGFLGLGCYRLKFAVKYFRERRRCNRR
jgi:hypothetical protein